jgi:hypothetical protein
MPASSGHDSLACITSQDVAQMMRSDYESLSFVANCVSPEVPSLSGIPTNLLRAHWFGRSVILCYGPAHPLYCNDGDNIARFKIWGQVSTEGSILCRTPGLDPPLSQPVTYLLSSTESTLIRFPGIWSSDCSLEC